MCLVSRSGEGKLTSWERVGFSLAISLRNSLGFQIESMNACVGGGSRIESSSD